MTIAGAIDTIPTSYHVPEDERSGKCDGDGAIWYTGKVGGGGHPHT